MQVSGIKTHSLGQSVRPSQLRELSQEDKAKVSELENTDREVRAHEQAHKSAAGQYAEGGASYTYTTGPDGRRYAVAGEVRVDTSPVSGDPDATLRKMQTLQRAANAPKNPSPQDRAVAADASQQANQARIELAEQRREQASGRLPGGLINLLV